MPNKLKIVGDGIQPFNTKVYVDGKELGAKITKINLTIEAGKNNKATLTMYLDDIDLELDADITINNIIPKSHVYKSVKEIIEKENETLDKLKLKH